MKQPHKAALFLPDVGLTLHGKRAACCWLRLACIVNLLSLRSTGGVSSFSAQSIQNVGRNSGLFSTVGTFSLIYLSAGWICVEPGFLLPCKLHSHSLLLSTLLSTSLIPAYCLDASHNTYSSQQHIETTVILIFFSLFLPFPFEFFLFCPHLMRFRSKMPLFSHDDKASSLNFKHTIYFVWRHSLSLISSLWELMLLQQPTRTSFLHRTHITNIFLFACFILLFAQTPLGHFLWRSPCAVCVCVGGRMRKKNTGSPADATCVCVCVHIQ